MPIKEEVLIKYKTKYFVETGTYYGQTLIKAIRMGFEEIYSVELSEHYYNMCNDKFDKYKNVNIMLGNSGDVLGDIIPKLDEQSTFWLDGHYSGGNTGRGDKQCPVIEELEQIEKSNIKNHIILIDDVRLFGKEEHDYLSLDTVKNKLLEINKDYKFKFEDGHVKNDILVAYV